MLKIAEVTSRFTNIDEFVKLVSALGFSLSHKVRNGDAHEFLSTFLLTRTLAGRLEHAFHPL